MLPFFPEVCHKDKNPLSYVEPITLPGSVYDPLNGSYHMHIRSELLVCLCFLEPFTLVLMLKTEAALAPPQRPHVCVHKLAFIPPPGTFTVYCPFTDI